MIELKIGQAIVAENSAFCKGCVFWRGDIESCLKPPQLECRDYCREDNTSVIFKVVDYPPAADKATEKTVHVLDEYYVPEQAEKVLDEFRVKMREALNEEAENSLKSLSDRVVEQAVRIAELEAALDIRKNEGAK